MIHNDRRITAFNFQAIYLYRTLFISRQQFSIKVEGKMVSEGKRGSGGTRDSERSMESEGKMRGELVMLKLKPKPYNYQPKIDVQLSSFPTKSTKPTQVQPTIDEGMQLAFYENWMKNTFFRVTSDPEHKLPENPMKNGYLRAKPEHPSYKLHSYFDLPIGPPVVEETPSSYYGEVSLSSKFKVLQ